MRSSLLAAALAVVLGPSGYRYEFPRNHFSHPEFETEWWYYTGNVQTPDHHRFGFELTFFRQATEPLAGETGVWRADQLYLAHLALTDIDGGHFYHEERLNRAGPGLAGADLNHQEYWNGNWRVRWKSLKTAPSRSRLGNSPKTLEQFSEPRPPGSGPNELGLTTAEQELQAVCDRFTLTLDLKP